MKRVSLIFSIIAAFALIVTAGTSSCKRKGSGGEVKTLAADEILTEETAEISVNLQSDNDVHVGGVLTPSEIGEFAREMTQADLETEMYSGAENYLPEPQGMFYNFDSFTTGGDSSWDCMVYQEEFTATSTLAPQGNTRYDADNLRNCKSKEAYIQGSGNRSVTWCEGVPGHGIGERVTMRVTTKAITPDNIVSFHSIMIVNGYARNETTWRNNARVKILRLYVGDRHWCDLHLSDVIKPQIFELPDDMRIMPHTSGKKVEQPREWRELHHNGPVYQTELSFEIKEVYPGERYEDTCITGIALDAYSGCY